MKWGYISAQKLKSERSKSFAVSISMQTEAIRGYLRVFGTEKYPQVQGNLAEVGQNHDAPKAASATVSVLK